MSQRLTTGQRIALAFVLLFFLVGGVAHFTETELEMRILPPWVPWPRFTILIFGVFELLGAAGLLLQRTRRMAGWGLFLLTIVVTPANIYMLTHHELFPKIPEWVLVLRLPLQLVLLWLIWWSTHAAARGGNPLRLQTRSHNPWGRTRR